MSQVNTDASWIRKTMRRKSLREFKKAKAQFQAEGELENGIKEVSPEFERKKQEISHMRRESKKKLDEMRKNRNSLKPEGAKKKKSLRKSLLKEFNPEEANKKKSLRKSILKEFKPEEAKKKKSLRKSILKEFKPQEDVEQKVEVKEETESGEEESGSEYDSEYDSESETEDEDASELNEMNFNKLLQIRVQSTDFQLENFCSKYIFILKEKGVRELHILADEFEDLCKRIYEPMLLRSKGNKRKKTLRKLTAIADIEAAVRQQSLAQTPKKEVAIPKEVPVEHEITVEFFKTHQFDLTGEEQIPLLQGLHIESSCCFLQFLLLKYKDLIIDQHCERWEKQREDLEEKNFGSLILEEFFMPPMNVEPKLDEELVKFSKLMASRQFEINQYKKRMMEKDPKSVAFNILQKEMVNYVKKMEDKINVSEIYFSAAIMKVRQQQQRELERIYELIENEDEAEAKLEESLEDAVVQVEETEDEGEETSGEEESGSEEESSSEGEAEEAGEKTVSD